MFWAYMGIPMFPLQNILGVPPWVSSVRPDRDGRDGRPRDGHDSDVETEKVRGPDPSGSEKESSCQIFNLDDYRRMGKMWYDG